MKTQSECERNIKIGAGFDRNQMICAGGNYGNYGYDNTDTCKGDSGGPLVVELQSNGQSSIVLAGVTSWGKVREGMGLSVRVRAFHFVSVRSD